MQRGRVGPTWVQAAVQQQRFSKEVVVQQAVRQPGNFLPVE